MEGLELESVKVRVKGVSSTRGPSRRRTTDADHRHLLAWNMKDGEERGEGVVLLHNKVYLEPRT